MSFESQEVSNQDGNLVALYLIEWGKTQWRYTSADRKIEREEEVDGDTVTVEYLPIAIKDGGMVQGSSSQNYMTVDAPSNIPIVTLFRGSPPSETIWMTIRRIHDDPQDAPIYWKGTVTNLKRPSDAKCQIIGQPLSAGLKKTGLRLCWTRECPHFLYDGGCKVNRLDFAVAGTLVSATGTQMVVDLEGDAIDSGWFRGGYIEWEASAEGTIERRMIENDTFDAMEETTTLDIFGLVDFIDIGDSVTCYPGCNRTPTVCDSKFDNIDNYGGFDKMPGASPFVKPIW